MNENLCCNINKCYASLSGHLWITSCLHVFCPEHGTTYFRNNRIQVNCPVCNEVNVRESDTLLSQTHQSDMILAGLRPEKIIRLVEKSFKLWKCQTEAERNHESSKIHQLSKQLEDNSNNFKRVLHKKEVEYISQVAGLQANYNDVMVKLKQVNQELEIVKSALRKYKEAYDLLANTRGPPGPRNHSPQRYLNLSSPILPPDIDENSSLGVSQAYRNLGIF